MCHGINGDGNGVLATSLNSKPRNFTSYEEMKHIPDLQIMSSIKNGIEESGMPAHDRLTDDELNELLNYVRTFLAQSYHRVNMCFTEKHSITFEDVVDDYQILNDKPDDILAELHGKELIVKPKDPIKFLKKLKQEKKRTARIGLRIFESKNQGAKTNLIVIRIHDCVRI